MTGYELEEIRAEIREIDDNPVGEFELYRLDQLIAALKNARIEARSRELGLQLITREPLCDAPSEGAPSPQ